MYLGKYLVYLDTQIIIFLEISIHLVSTDISNDEFCVDMLEKILMVIMVKYGMIFWLLSRCNGGKNIYMSRKWNGKIKGPLCNSTLTTEWYDNTTWLLGYVAHHDLWVVMYYGLSIDVAFSSSV